MVQYAANLAAATVLCGQGQRGCRAFGSVRAAVCLATQAYMGMQQRLRASLLACRCFTRALVRRCLASAWRCLGPAVQVRMYHLLERGENDSCPCVHLRGPVAGRASPAL